MGVRNVTGSSRTLWVGQRDWSQGRRVRVGVTGGTTPLEPVVVARTNPVKGKRDTSVSRKTIDILVEGMDKTPEMGLR